MKQQVAALLLSALFFSTLAHEHWRAKEHPPPSLLKHHQEHGSRSLSHLQTRDDPNGQCFDICQVPVIPGSLQLNVTINIEASLIITVNVQSNTALVIDVNNGLAALFNGTSGEIVIVNIRTQTVIYLASGKTSLAWKVSEKSAAVFFANISLTAIWTAGQQSGESSSSSSVSTQVLQIVAVLISSVSTQYGVILKDSFKLSVSIFIRIAVSISTAVSGGGAGLLQLLVSGSTAIQGGIEVLVVGLASLQRTIVSLGVSIQVLIQKSIKFDVSYLGNSANGIDVLAYVIGTISAQVDISASVRTILSSANSFFAFAASLSARADIVAVISSLLVILDSNNSNNATLVGAFVTTLIYYVTDNSTGSANVTQQLQQSIAVFLHIAQSFGINVAFLQQISSGNWVVNGVNVTAVINVLASVGANVALQAIFSVFSLIGNVVQLTFTLQSLIVNIIFLLVSNGVGFVLRLIPALAQLGGSLLELIAGLAGIFAQLLLNLPKILIVGLYQVLKDIQLFGVIINAFEQAVVQAQGGVAVNIKTIINSFDVSVILRIIVDVIKVGSAAASSGTVTVGWGLSGGVSIGGGITVGGGGGGGLAGGTEGGYSIAYNGTSYSTVEYVTYSYAVTAGRHQENHHQQEHEKQHIGQHGSKKEHHPNQKHNVHDQRKKHEHEQH